MAPGVLAPVEKRAYSPAMRTPRESPAARLSLPRSGALDLSSAFEQLLESVDGLKEGHSTSDHRQVDRVEAPRAAEAASEIRP